MSDKQKDPISKEDIPKNPDPKIDQDFQGYPHGPASDDSIKPKTKEQKELSEGIEKDGEKVNKE